MQNICKEVHRLNAEEVMAFFEKSSYETHAQQVIL